MPLKGAKVYWQKVPLAKTVEVPEVLLVTVSVEAVSLAVRLNVFEPQNGSKGHKNYCSVLLIRRSEEQNLNSFGQFSPLSQQYPSFMSLVGQ